MIQISGANRFDPAANYEITKKRVGYVERADASEAVYRDLGFKCGLEIHQQLRTEKKLFCRCPSGLYQNGGEYDAEVIRHMRPTLSELGEYDGTALMEFKTKKNITYRLKYETACTYDIDDTPPFPINREALAYALEISLLLKQNIVGELHITRKQYLDGSIPTGFQRTGIIGIEGEIPLKNKKVRLIQLSLEEDSCREVSDIGHERIYTTDRLGVPLIETVTHPELLTPDEAAEAAHYLRFLVRSTGRVRTGIGAARQDVNVSVTGGTRVEIKGVAHISWIPDLVHNEAFRQKALLDIRTLLADRVKNNDRWKISSDELNYDDLPTDFEPIKQARVEKKRLIGVNLPGFRGVLSHFTQPGHVFADELIGRLKVIACLDRPNMVHSEQPEPVISTDQWERIAKRLKAGSDDTQLLIWTSDADLKCALETIEERCQMAFEGVPNETRKSLTDGTTIFERVLPGADRMYPDTDSAPISISEEMIEEGRRALPTEVFEQMEQLREWRVPVDTWTYILRNNLMPTIRRIVAECDQAPVFVGTVFGHTLKHYEGQLVPATEFSYNKAYGLFKYIHDQKLVPEIVRPMLAVVYEHPNILFDSVLVTIGYERNGNDQLRALIAPLKTKFRQINTSTCPSAESHWIMGQIRKHALGNIRLADLRNIVDEETKNG